MYYSDILVHKGNTKVWGSCSLGLLSPLLYSFNIPPLYLPPSVVIYFLLILSKFGLGFFGESTHIIWAQEYVFSPKKKDISSFFTSSSLLLMLVLYFLFVDSLGSSLLLCK